MDSDTFFIRSRSIWFPDFEQALVSLEQRCAVMPPPTDALRCILAYFRGEISRGAFIARFPALPCPPKMLRRERALYECAAAFCADGESAEGFDDRLLLCLRSRPGEDVFSPSFEAWEELCALICRIQTKQTRLPQPLSGVGWCAYLNGNVTRAEFSRGYFVKGIPKPTEDSLFPGFDTAAPDAQYSAEFAACWELAKLCREYREGSLSPEAFDLRYLELAHRFCGEA